MRSSWTVIARSQSTRTASFVLDGNRYGSASYQHPEEKPVGGRRREAIANVQPQARFSTGMRFDLEEKQKTQPFYNYALGQALANRWGGFVATDGPLILAQDNKVSCRIPENCSRKYIRRKVCLLRDPRKGNSSGTSIRDPPHPSMVPVSF